MEFSRLGSHEQQLRAERRNCAELLRVLLSLDAAMWLCPHFTLRLLTWADPDLATLMASTYA